MMTLLFAVWVTGALVYATCVCLADEFLTGFGLWRSLLLAAVVTALWPISLGLAVVFRLWPWRHRLFVAVLLLFVPSAGQAQTPNFGGEERTESLTYKGVRANAQTKPENHTRNRHPTIPMWGGCVPSSVRTAALHAGIPRDQIDKFWRIAQRRVGVNGTDPNLLAAMLREAFPPSEGWISYTGSDPAEVQRVYDKLSAKGYLVCSTMGWGALYGNRKIAHMVSDPHYSSKDGVAAVEDNNDPPGVYRWMPTRERLARALSGGQAWIFAFTRQPPLVQVEQLALAAAFAALAAAILLFATSVLALGCRHLVL